MAVPLGTGDTRVLLPLELELFDAPLYLVQRARSSSVAGARDARPGAKPSQRDLVVASLLRVGDRREVPRPPVIR